VGGGIPWKGRSRSGPKIKQPRTSLDLGEKKRKIPGSYVQGKLLTIRGALERWRGACGFFGRHRSGAGLRGGGAKKPCAVSWMQKKAKEEGGTQKNKSISRQSGKKTKRVEGLTEEQRRGKTSWLPKGVVVHGTLLYPTYGRRKGDLSQNLPRQKKSRKERNRLRTTRVVLACGSKKVKGKIQRLCIVNTKKERSKSM